MLDGLVGLCIFPQLINIERQCLNRAAKPTIGAYILLYSLIKVQTKNQEKIGKTFYGLQNISAHKFVDFTNARTI